jgi:HNH endonuclease
MNQLDEAGRRLLGVLVEHIARSDVMPGQPETFLSYKETHSRLGLTCDADGHHRYGQCLKRHGLDSLANWTKETGLPAITGLIVEKETLEPSTGYFNLYGQTDDPYAWWENQVRSAKDSLEQWAPFLAVAVPQSTNQIGQAAGDISKNTPQHPLPLPPTVLNTVYDMVKAGGINVDDWAVSADSMVIDNPRNNIGRNTAWSFVGMADEPIILCVWHDLINWDHTRPIFSSNESHYQQEVLAALSKTNDSGNKARLRRWLNRSSAFYAAVYKAFRTRCPVRIILLAGQRVAPDEPLPENKGVVARELDSVTWYVHACDGESGAYTIVRGVEPPQQESQNEPQYADDPLHEPALFSLLATLDDTEAQAVIKARTRQSQFRSGLLDRWKTCSVTNCGYQDVLMASHIKPWARCTTYEERVGVANGLLLTPNLDKLFDSGLITFADNLHIKISPMLPAGWLGQLGVNRNMRIRSGHVDILPFLAWHREHCYFETAEQRAARCHPTAL